MPTSRPTSILLDRPSPLGPFANANFKIRLSLIHFPAFLDIENKEYVFASAFKILIFTMFRYSISPISFLIALTLIFASITLIIQFDLFHSRSEKLFNKYSGHDHLSRFSYFSNNNKNHLLTQDNYEKLMQKVLELGDLKQQKKSFLNELKRIEVKRAKLLKSIDHSRLEIDFLLKETNKLNEKNSHLKLRIIHNQLKLIELDSSLNDSLNSISSKRLYNFSYDNMLNKSDIWVDNEPSCKIETCVDFSNCKQNEKINLFIFPNQLEEIRNYFDFKTINMSINFVNNQQNACFVVIFLLDFGQIKKLIENFSAENNSKSNFLFINLINNDSDNNQLIEFIKSKQELKSLFSKSFYASFQNPNKKISPLIIDFSLALFSNYEQVRNISFITLKKRPYLFTYHQNPIRKSDTRLQFLEKEINNSTIIDLDCESSKNMPGFDVCFDSDSRLNILEKSVFTLLVPDCNFYQSSIILRLIEAIKSASVPVLLDSDFKLPLEDLINWNECAIRLPYTNIPSLNDVLKTVKQSEILKRQIHCKNLHDAYFPSATAQFRTIIAALSHKIFLNPSSIHNLIPKNLSTEDLNLTNSSFSRLFSISPDDYNDDYNVEDENDKLDEFVGEINQNPLKSDEFVNKFIHNHYLSWNKYFYPFNMFPSTPFDTTEYSNFNLVNLKDFADEIPHEVNFNLGGGDGHVFNHRLSGNFKEEQFTVVILNYKREAILSDLIEKYLKLPYLHSIIIVYNAIDSNLSNQFIFKFNMYLKSKRITVIKSDKNSLNNRFFPYESIKTDAVLSLDDDMFLRPDEIMLAFRTWRENREKIVGFPARYHTWNFTVQNFEYKSYLSCEYSMVLTGAAFYHRFYNYIYSYVMDKRILNLVDELRNCEDIAFNMMVSHMTRRAPLKVSTKYTFYCKECENVISKSENDLPVSLRAGHYQKRSFCLQNFIKIYGYNPLLYSQFRADSVLYRTRVGTNVQKCFKYV